MSAAPQRPGSLPSGRFIAEVQPLPPGFKHRSSGLDGSACLTCGRDFGASRQPRAVFAATYVRGGGFHGFLCGTCCAAPPIELHERIAACLQEFLGASVRVVVGTPGGRA